MPSPEAQPSGVLLLGAIHCRARINRKNQLELTLGFPQSRFNTKGNTPITHRGNIWTAKLHCKPSAPKR